MILGETQITSKGALQLSQLPTMEWLDLSWSKVDDRIMPMCSEFKALEILNLNGTGITDVGLQDLASGQAAEHLEHLELSDTKITDKSVETLSNFRQLKHLTISGSLMTSADVEKLSELCRNCELLPTDW